MANKKDDDLTFKINKKAYGPERFFITKENYVYDRWIFRGLSAVIVVCAIIMFFQIGGLGSKYAYASCGDDFIGHNLPCDNPLYGKCDLPACQKAVLQPGENIGEKPPERREDFYFLIILLVVGVFVANHLAHNMTNEAQEKARLYNARHKNNTK